jgi:phosphoserine phosphatase RsbU/P
MNPMETANTILIVDDTPANLHLLTQMLNKYGYKTRPLPDGAKALALVQKAPPDLILLDIMMPDLDGYEVCRQLKANERTRDIPVIFLSALNEVTNKVKGFEVGGVDYITKPFQMEEVLARVRTHLALRQTQLQLQTAMKQLQTLYQNLQNQLALAQATQAGLLPAPRPNWPHLEVICYSNQALEIGGDFYNYHAFTPPQQRYALTIGDISGKGVSAALLMAACLSQLDASFVHDFTPSERLTHLDRTISSYTQPHKQNCALIYVEILVDGRVQTVDPNSSPLSSTVYHLLTVVNAGCIPPYIKRVTGEVEMLDVGGFALGQNLTRLVAHEVVEVAIYSGDVIILVSDGVVEAMNLQQEMFGFERLMAAIQAAPIVNAEAMLEYLKTTLIGFVDGAPQHDDITIVVARVG